MTLKGVYLPFYLLVFSDFKGIKNMLLTVFIHSEDRGPAHRQLSEGLPWRRGDVVPAFTCRGTTALELWLHLDHYWVCYWTLSLYLSSLSRIFDILSYRHDTLEY